MSFLAFGAVYHSRTDGQLISAISRGKVVTLDRQTR